MTYPPPQLSSKGDTFSYQRFKWRMDVSVKLFYLVTTSTCLCVQSPLSLPMFLSRFSLLSCWFMCKSCLIENFQFHPLSNGSFYAEKSAKANGRNAIQKMASVSQGSRLGIAIWQLLRYFVFESFKFFIK